MFTAISAIVGLLGSVLPSVVRLFERKAELSHDIAVEKIKYDTAIAAGKIQLDLTNIKADVDEGQSLRSYDDVTTDSSFVKALRGSVRPIVTYVLFGLFVAVKTSAAFVMIKNGNDIPTMLQMVWDQDTAALFATIIMFWFGTRAYEKSRRYGAVLEPMKKVAEPTSKPTTPLNKK
jgi:hypothetical protein